MLPFFHRCDRSYRLNPVPRRIFSQDYKYYHIHEPDGELPELKRHNETTENSFKAQTDLQILCPRLLEVFVVFKDLIKALFNLRRHHKYICQSLFLL